MADINYATDDPAGQYFATHQAQGDAWAQLQAVLAEYGLGSLSNFVENGIMLGWDANQAAQHLRETPEWQSRFSAIVQRQKLGLPPLSEADVINNERQYAQQMQSVGLPSGFYDQPADFTSLLVNDVSPAELQDRLVKGYQAAQMAPPETKAALQSFYGLTDGDLAAYYIDPQKTEALLQKQLTSAQIAGTATQTGWGGLAKTQAERLSELGITPDQAQQGFGTLATQHELMGNLPGEAGTPITQEQQLSAAFEGNAANEQLIKQRAQQRLAEFQNAGGYAQTKTGTSVGQAR